MKRDLTDALSMADREHASQVAYKALNAIQNDKPHLQVLGAGMLFAALARRLGLSPEELHSQADRMLRAEAFEGVGNARCRAMAEYAGHVIADKPQQEAAA